MIQRIRRFDVGQAAKVLGLLYLLLGVVFAVIFWLVGSMIPAAEKAQPGMAIFGGAMLLFLPILYGIVGAVMGAIASALYNMIASWVGGFEIELEGADAARYRDLA
ncbi:MAG TPA: hypothetical protein VFL88_07800 [Gemmatimonadales bacterium]|jgi:hypothetical protein|nr:hypothetical protein [Gemmatimonadales bacterium]